MTPSEKNEFLDIFKGFAAYKLHALVITLMVTLLGGGYFLYDSYKEGIEVKAHADFIEAMQFFDARVEGDFRGAASEDVESFDTAEKKWSKVVEVFDDAYVKNKKAAIAPMFLTHKAEALINLNRLDEAIEVLKAALSMHFPSTLKQFYLLKFALMQVDSESYRSEGLEILEALTDEHQFIDLIKKTSIGDSVKLPNDKNYVHDLALFRLGEHYWFTKRFDQSKNYWNRLLIKYGKETKNPSVWADKAMEKLQLIEGK